MSVTTDDLKRLKFSIAAAMVLAGSGIAALLVAENSLESAVQARQGAAAARLEAQKRVASVAEEEKEIRENLRYYEKMVTQGMVGGENRLDWIDTITAIKTERKLFDISYSIAAQKEVNYPGIQQGGASGFVASQMKLDMNLLHEDDLLNFLEDLQKRSKSLVSVRQCSLSRQDRGASPTGAISPRLRSDCQVDLITLRLAKRS